ncbi:MAG: type I-C CRISPR-associated protein Cas7/Csd2 [Planctomycetales bacterium 71-10]|nr:MAG: type I-C CRISPR-associated protein Cas7/Csd2 [Planctomycetales bacterium 71-10]
MASDAALLDKRYEFVLFFDVQDGNPNGDPDAGNAPRVDPETGQGLVTDVCLKRKVRNFVQLTQAEGVGEDAAPKAGFEIYVKEKGILALRQKRAYEALKLQPDNKPSTVKETRAWMCKTFFDVRAFGAVMSTGKAGDEDVEEKAEKKEKAEADKKEKKKPAAGAQKLWNCGQVRGPIQLSFARSVEPILALEHAITRVALTNASDTTRGQEVGGEEASSGQIGRKSTIPYGLYRAHGFVSPYLARDTGFTKADLELFWQALVNMFDHDRSASRGLMAARRLIVFEHDSALGSAPAHKLFDKVACNRKDADSKKPARSFDDYVVTVDEAPVAGVTVHERI